MEAVQALDPCLEVLDVDHRLPAFLRKGHEARHRGARAGDEELHLLDEGRDPDGHRRVDPFGGDDEAVGLGYPDPVDIDPQGLEGSPENAPRPCRPELAELVERGLELEAAPNEARREAAQYIVPLEEEHAPPPEGYLASGGHAAVPASDDHDIVAPLCRSHCDPSRASRPGKIVACEVY